MLLRGGGGARAVGVLFATYLFGLEGFVLCCFAFFLYIYFFLHACTDFIFIFWVRYLSYSSFDFVIFLLWKRARTKRVYYL